MAEVGNLTYNITANMDSEVLSSIMKELQSLRDEVSQIRGSQLIHEAWVDCQESKLGKKVAELVSAKYKEMLAEHEAVDHARKVNDKTLDEYTEEWKALISGATLVSPRPFTIQNGQVYINQAHIKEATIETTTNKCARWSFSTDRILEVFYENGTLRTRVQL